jgi:CRP-like cAMP-binding protein
MEGGEPDEDIQEEESEDGEQMRLQASYLGSLQEGAYFGEISLMTSLKRTATVKAKEFCTLGFLTKKVFQNAKLEYPQIWKSFKNKIQEDYQDESFKFRRNVITNVPYFKGLSDQII